MKELNLDVVKETLTEMNIPYREEAVPENLANLIRIFKYRASSLIVDLTNVDTVEAELGVVVQNENQNMDNGIYIFTVLHSGQAGFIVVQPSDISRAPLIRKVTGDLISAVTAVELPPLQPFDMIEITAHLLAGTFMKTIMKSWNIPEEQELNFLRLYMPKFLANVGLYFVGAEKEDGSPMVYEETANIEPMIAWESLRKGADNKNEQESRETDETAAKESDGN